MNEIEFKKYKSRGAYHWVLASQHPIKGNAFVRARYLLNIQLLREALGDPRGKDVLDYGCGDGYLTYLVDRLGCHAYGVDTSDEGLQLARAMMLEKKGRATFRLAEGGAAPFEGNAFDAVLCSDVIEHVADPRVLLQDIARILKPRGVGIISTPVRLTEVPLDAMHVQEWFPSEFSSLIASVFPNSRFQMTHPVYWSEFFSQSIWSRIFVNMYALIRNPFLFQSNTLNALQWAIVKP